MSRRQTTSGVASVVRTYSSEAFALDELLASRGRSTVSVVVPARNEEATIGAVVEAARAAGIVDELVVVDDGSEDGTAAVAAAAGARVVTASGGPGKGEAMADGVAATTGDVVVFLDADVTNVAPHFVTGLAGPLLVSDSVQLVKGTYRRSFEGQEGEGGRVTELVARPLLRVMFPELVAIGQPLAGETAVRRRVLDRVGLARGYAVELALLVDTWRHHGIESIAQVDLGVRHHRHQSLAALAVQAQQIVEAAVDRSGHRLPVAVPD